MPFISMGNTSGNGGTYGNLDTLQITPTGNNIIYTPASEELIANNVINVLYTGFIGSTVSFANCTVAKSMYVRNSDINSSVTFGTVVVPASSIAQILIEVGGATTVLQAAALYDSTSNDPKDTVVIAASNSSTAWKARALYICDGNADESEINNALNAYNGGNVWLAPGTYNTAGSIVMPSSTTLMGADASNTIIGLGFNSTVSMVSNCVVQNITLTRTAAALNNAVVTMQGDGAILISSNVNDLVSTSGQTIWLSGGYVSEIAGCTITGGVIGISGGGQHSNIHDNRITMTNVSSGSTSLIGINCTNDNTIIQHNLIQATSTATTCMGIKTTGNNVRMNNNTISGQSYFKHGVYVETGTSPFIVNNQLMVSGLGIYSACTNAKIYANTIYSYGAGVYLNGGNRSMVHTNTIQINTTSPTSNGAIMVATSLTDVVIRDNIIVSSNTGATWGGIYCLSTMTAAEIVGNQMDLAAGRSLYLSGNVVNCVIANNITNGATYGLYCGGTVNGTAISNNVITAVTAGGMYFAGTVTNTTVTTNNIKYYDNTANTVGITFAVACTMVNINSNNIGKAAGTTFTSTGIVFGGTMTGTLATNAIQYYTLAFTALSGITESGNYVVSVGT